LDLSNNKIDENASKIFFDFLKNNKNLKYIEVNGNKLNPKYLVECLGYNQTLNQITFECKNLLNY
jgi:hypothetical protein